MTGGGGGARRDSTTSIHNLHENGPHIYGTGAALEMRGFWGSTQYSMPLTKDISAGYHAQLRFFPDGHGYGGASVLFSV